MAHIQEGATPLRFGSIFTAIFLGTALIVASYLVQHARPASQVARPIQDLVNATGKCAACHRRETPAIVHQYEASAHAAHDVTCLDCHIAAGDQNEVEHNGFRIGDRVTPANCEDCHSAAVQQFLRSRHAAPAWGAVTGSVDFSADQIKAAETLHPGTIQRPANPLVALEGAAASVSGCATCHGIGKPNPDGSIGSCTGCHGRHRASVALSRRPETCGQCHMGPDHSQLEIYNESKHGILFKAQEREMNLEASPKSLGTKDMPVPTCATCHMSGIEGLEHTHDTTERLSWFLADSISTRRPGYETGQKNMKATCLKCHAQGQVETVYRQAEAVVSSTNARVEKVRKLIDEMRAEGLLTPAPFDEPIEFLWFDYWHYFGCTAKHGAFMGGADFVQWHGNYELLKLLVEIEDLARHLREGLSRPEGAPPGESKGPE